MIMLRFLLWFMMLSIGKGGEGIMIIVSVTLIIAKRRTINDVPTTIRKDVLADLEALGYDGYGNLLNQ